MMNDYPMQCASDRELESSGSVSKLATVGDAPGIVGIDHQTMVFTLPGNEALGVRLSVALGAVKGSVVIRKCSDGDYYVRGVTPCKGLDVVLVANLYQTNDQILPILFGSRALRLLGARRVLLVAPYVPYMRQNAGLRFGEVETARTFRHLLGNLIDGLVTINPVPCYSTAEAITAVPSHVEHALEPVAAWIRENVNHPVIVGSDRQTIQWISQVARIVGAPFMMLSRTQHSGGDAEILVPQLDRWRNHTPILMEHSICTARTMINTTVHLQRAGFRRPVCIGVHALFTGDAYNELRASGIDAVVTCNTVDHPSNAIDMTESLAVGVRRLMDDEYTR